MASRLDINETPVSFGLPSFGRTKHDTLNQPDRRHKHEGRHNILTTWTTFRLDNDEDYGPLPPIVCLFQGRIQDLDFFGGEGTLSAEGAIIEAPQALNTMWHPPQKFF